jgi:DNA-binding NtrC family response regulator
MSGSCSYHAKRFCRPRLDSGLAQRTCCTSSRPRSWFSESPDILPEHLSAAVRAPLKAAAGGEAGLQDLPTLDALEQAHIETVLRAAHGHRGQAARVLGISERNPYRKLRIYGLLD